MERKRLMMSVSSNSTSSSKMIMSYGGHEEYNNIVGGFSWPPRCYTCSFCKREFRSAQALGGHMNVHRRDRARLRLSSPPLLAPPPPPLHAHHHHHNINLNANPNPNPNPSPNSNFLYSPSSAFTTTTTTTSLPPLVSSPSSASPPGPGELRKWVFPSILDATPQECDNHHHHKLRLNLEIGQFSDHKEDLDLELRLGYSN